MTIDQLMSKDIHFCSPEESLSSAAQTMWSHDCGCVAVCEIDGAPKLVGMLTDRDICMSALFQQKPLSELRIRDAMSQTISTCRPSDSPVDVEQIMRKQRVRRVPVTNDEGQLLGIVSLADLARGSGRSRSSGGPTATEVTGTLAAISAARG